LTSNERWSCTYIVLGYGRKPSHDRVVNFYFQLHKQFTFCIWELPRKTTSIAAYAAVIAKSSCCFRVEQSASMRGKTRMKIITTPRFIDWLSLTLVRIETGNATVTAARRTETVFDRISNLLLE